MYKKMYFRLAGVLADAIEAIEEKRYEKAKDILIKASQDAEDMFIEWEDEPECDL